MSIFTKPLSQLGTADLQELVKDGAVENTRLVPNRSAAHRPARRVARMANSVSRDG